MQRLGGRGPFPHAMLLPNDGAESFAPRARDSGDDGVRMQKCSVTWKWFMQNAPRRCRDECVLYVCVCDARAFIVPKDDGGTHTLSRTAVYTKCSVCVRVWVGV